LLVLLGFGTCWGINAWILRRSAPGIVANVDALNGAHTIIVLGSFVNDAGVSGCVEERLQRGLEVYKAGKGKRFLLTGDHGRKGYDEVNTMMERLIALGVPRADIFLDHAGFDTYDSMWRAKHVFQVRDAVIVSQGFHLPRAQYLATSVGLETQGIPADPVGGSVCDRAGMREPLARIKAFFNVVLDAAPHHRGDPVPITGPASASHDR
jgi:SanA protein